MIGLLLAAFRFFSAYKMASTEKCAAPLDAEEKDTLTSYVRRNLRSEDLGPCRDGLQTIRYRGTDTAYTVPCPHPVQDFLKMNFCFVFSASRTTILLFSGQLVCSFALFILLIVKISETKRLTLIGLQSLVPPSLDPVTTTIFVGVTVVSCVSVLWVSDKGTPVSLMTKPVRLRGRVRDGQGRFSGH